MGIIEGTENVQKKGITLKQKIGYLGLGIFFTCFLNFCIGTSASAIYENQAAEYAKKSAQIKGTISELKQVSKFGINDTQGFENYIKRYDQELSELLSKNASSCEENNKWMSRALIYGYFTD